MGSFARFRVSYSHITSLQAVIEHAPWCRHFLAFFAGALYPLGLGPHSNWPALILSMVLYITIVLRPGELNKSRVVHRHIALGSFFYGFGLYYFGTDWFYHAFENYFTMAFNSAPTLTTIVGGVCFSALLSLMWFAPLGYVFSRLQLKRYYLFAFPSLWLLAEWWKVLIFPEIPVYFTGYGFIDTVFAGWAPVLGVQGVTWIAALVASLAFMCFSHLKYGFCIRRKNKLIPGIFGIAIIWTVSYGIYPLNWTQLSKTVPLRVSLIQTNTTPKEKWDGQNHDAVKSRLLAVSKKEWADKSWSPDVIVWPELTLTSIPTPEYIGSLQREAERYNSSLLVGALSLDPTNGNYYNSMSLIEKPSRSIAYFKQQLIPIFEYVPAEQLIGKWVNSLVESISFSHGSTNQLPLTISGYRIAPFICYEILFPSLVSRVVQNNDLIITVSNDSWFGVSLGLHLHAEMARMRAIESGRSIVRTNNSAITAVYDHKGRIIQQAPQFEQIVLRAEVYGRKGVTPFMHFGAIPILVLSILIILLIIYRCRLLPERY